MRVQRKTRHALSAPWSLLVDANLSRQVAKGKVIEGGAYERIG